MLCLCTESCVPTLFQHTAPSPSWCRLSRDSLVLFLFLLPVTSNSCNICRPQWFPILLLHLVLSGLPTTFHLHFLLCSSPGHPWLPLSFPWNACERHKIFTLKVVTHYLFIHYSLHPQASLQDLLLTSLVLGTEVTKTSIILEGTFQKLKAQYNGPHF